VTSSDNNLPRSLGNELLATLCTVAEVLQRRSVKYALIGGLAVVARGRVRTTKDIDFLISVSQFTMPRLLDDLAEAGFPIDQTASIQRWNYEGLMPLISGSGIRIDFMKAVLPVFDNILQRASEENFQGLKLRIIDVEGLLLLKLIAFRPQDQIDIRALLAANVGRIDLDWVRREWAQLSGLDPSRTAQFETMVQEFSEPPAQ
jgi:predicted nucleotidyltransferase